MERVSDLDGVGQHRFEQRAIRRGYIERRPLDPSQPHLVTSAELTARPAAVTARHQTEKLAAAHVDDPRRPQLGAELTNPREQRLVQPERRQVADPVGVIDLLLTNSHHGIHDRVPTTSEMTGHVRDSAVVAADLDRRTQRCPGNQRTPGSGDLRALVASGAPTSGATPALLAPHHPGRAAEDRQVHGHGLVDSVAMHRTNRRTCRPLAIDRDDNPQP